MPTFVYDDDCGFCSWFATQMYQYTDWGVVGFSQLTADERAALPEDYEDEAHIIFDDYVRSGGDAMEHALAAIGVFPEDARRTLSQVLVYRQVRDASYEAVVERRDTFGRVFSSDSPPTRR